MSKSDVEITKIDQKSLYKTYEKWDQHFKSASTIRCTSDHSPDYYDSVYFCGMGGSATSGEILNQILEFDSSIFSAVLRGHDRISRNLTKRSLVAVSSVSGDTEETVSMCTLEPQRGAEVITISSGGRLQETASSLGLKHVTIPNLSLPRASLPYLIMPGLHLVEQFLNHSVNFESVCNSITETAQRISVNVPLEKNPAKQISNFLMEGFAFCYTSPYLLSVGNRFKNSLNENAKVHCPKETILEASHNEIVPFTFSNNNFVRKVILLQWILDDAFSKNRFRKFKSLFNEIGQPWVELIISDSDIISALLNSVYTLDYSTVLMAISKNLDPSPTPAIDILKRLKPM